MSRHAYARVSGRTSPVSDEFLEFLRQSVSGQVGEPRRLTQLAFVIPLIVATDVPSSPKALGDFLVLPPGKPTENRHVDRVEEGSRSTPRPSGDRDGPARDR